MNVTDMIKCKFFLSFPYLTYPFFAQFCLMKMIFVTKGCGLRNASVPLSHLLELRKGHEQLTPYSLSRQTGLIF